jgi:hypothetical protein
MEASVGDHLERSLPLRLLHLLIKKDVDAKRVYVGMGDRLIGTCARARMEEIGGPLGETTKLARELLLAGPLKHPVGE